MSESEILQQLADIIESANQYEECLVPLLVDILKQGKMPTKEDLEK